LSIPRRGAEIPSHGVPKPAHVANWHWIIEPKFGSLLVDAFLATGAGAQTSCGIAGEKLEQQKREESHAK
jgi:hypothetical protein